MAEKSKISLTELCRTLVDEFAVALAAVKRSHPSVTVRSATVGIGQNEEDITSFGNNGGNGPRLLLSDSYPGSENGWQLKLEMGEKPAATIGGVDYPLTDRPTPMLLDIVGTRPLDVIDGISSKWSHFFENLGIKSLDQLARLEEPGLREIVTECSSLRVREFRQKVLLLTLPLPILPSSGLDDISIHELLYMPLQSIQSSFAKITSPERLNSLLEMLDILNVVFDSRFLRKIKLREFIEC